MRTLSIGLLCLFGPTAHAQIVGGEFYLYDQYGGTTSNGALGISVAGIPDIDGDGVPDYMMGAPGLSPPGVFGGGTVFVHSGATGSLLFLIEGNEPHAWFGMTLAHAGDFNHDGTADLLIGSPYASPGGRYGAIAQAGSVFVHSGVDASLLHRFDGRSAGDLLGLSLGHAGDINGDGVDDVIFGTPWASVNQYVRHGMIAVCSGGTGELMYRYQGLVEYGRLGWQVAGAGDVDGDGFGDFLYSAPGLESGGLIGVGSIYLHSGFDGSLIRQIDGTVAGQALGEGLAVLGDLDGDGVDDFATNQFGSSSLGTTDQVVVFSGVTGSVIRAFETLGFHGAGFGRTIAGVGDVDGDGTPDVLVGSPYEWVAGVYQAGSAYLFSGLSGQLMQRFDGSLREDRLGNSVSALGDLQGDGHPEFLIGAPGGDYLEPDSGEVFIQSLNPYLHASRRNISTSYGGTVQLAVDFPNSHAGETYRILLSAHGVGPSNYGVDIPLAFDGFVQDSFAGRYPFANRWGLIGVLDANGDAQGGFRLPGGLPSGAVGEYLWLAAIAHPAGQLPSISSIVIPIQLVP